jgi:hypothetical protein
MHSDALQLNSAGSRIQKGIYLIDEEQVEAWLLEKALKELVTHSRNTINDPLGLCSPGPCVIGALSKTT